MLTDCSVAVIRLICDAVAVAGAAPLVLHLAAVREHVRRVALEGVLQAEPVLDPRREREGLERRPGLAALEGPVERALEVVLATEDPAHGAGLVVQRDRTGVELLEPLGLHRVHPVADRPHHRLGEGGRDPEPATVDRVVVVAEPVQLVLDHLEHEALLARVGLRPLERGEGGESRAQLVGLGRVERAHLRHPAEHVAVAAEQALPRLRPLGRVEVLRRVEDRGEHRALLDGQVLGVDAEVRLCRRLDAVGAAAEVDGVEVALEDLALGQLLLQLQGDERLLDLALERALGGQVVDLHVLLCDRRRALRRAALGVGEGGPQDALGIDAAVGPEGAVLGGDDRVTHMLGHLLERDRLAVLLHEPAQTGLAVLVVDVRGLGLEVLVGCGDRRRAVDVDETERADDHEHQGGDQADPEEPSPAPAAALGSVAAVAGRLLRCRGPGRAGLPLSTHGWSAPKVSSRRHAGFHESTARAGGIGPPHGGVVTSTTPRRSRPVFGRASRLCDVRMYRYDRFER